MKPGGVVFDCDGVLVDSEPHSIRSWVAVLDDLGHPADADAVAACTGLGFVPTRAALDAIGPLPAPELLWPRLLSALSRSFDDGLALFPDAIETLDAVVAAGIPVAVASASPRSRLDLTLRAADLTGVFPVSVSGDDVAEGKPAPDAYLLAAERLELDPAVCVAIEDSATGATSARAARMAVVAVVREAAHRPGLEATGARVVDRLSPDLLGL